MDSGLAAPQVGYCRLGHLMGPISGKPAIGWRPGMTETFGLPAWDTPGSTAHYRPAGRSCRFATPTARLRPSWPVTDIGCSATVRLEPPTRTLAPNPAAIVASPLAPI